MLHAAIMLSELRVVNKILKIGADPDVVCNRFGSCAELSLKVEDDAKSVGNQHIQDIQQNIRMTMKLTAKR